ncbi:MAG: ATP-binding protein, partial [Cohaesibacter sp.]|nr:ATP-binding protein [Cohaesibacter sp.]
MSTKVKDPAQYTQHSALSDIVSWSENRPAWQRDALRQLVNGYGCEEIDLQRLEAICLDELDDFAPIAEKDIAIQKINGEPVNLTQLKSVVGVNALAAQQELNIAENGITIIYGDNGSGKSGYCRVLKHACRTRDNKFAILP